MVILLMEAKEFEKRLTEEAVEKRMVEKADLLAEKAEHLA